MNEEEIQKMLDFIKTNYATNGIFKGTTLWDLVEQTYGEEKVMELMDRGFIFEPVLGRIRVIQ